MIRTRAAVPLIGAVIKRPDLWATALRQLLVLAPRGWWKKWPPVPLPDDNYLGFRFETAYGNPNATPTASDVTHYLAWCKRQRALAR